jgi:hypothetical protein
MSGETPDWRAAAKVIELAGMDRQGHVNPNLDPFGTRLTDPDAIIEAEARRRRPDPLQDAIDGGPVTQAEREAVLQDVSARLMD